MSLSLLRRFLHRRWPSFLSGILIILGYFLIHLTGLPGIFGDKVTTIAFVVLAIVILIPVRDYLIEPFLTFSSWDSLLEVQRHHLEFLARPFTLETLLKEITPELLVWLKIPDARMFILKSNRNHYDMHVYREGELSGSRPVSRMKLRPVTGIFRLIDRPARLDDPSLSPEVIQIMERFHFALAIPFVHRGRLMGLLTLRQPTQHRYSDRGLELFAAKAAITIHDHLLKSRMQNIAEYDEELRVAEKIRQMLQMQEPPNVPGWTLKTGQIRSATLVEFFSTEHAICTVLLSMRSGGSVSAMILSGALGYLFALVRIQKGRIDMEILMDRVRGYLAENDLLDRLEILVLSLRPEGETASVEATGKGYQIIDIQGRESPFTGRVEIPCPRGEVFSILYRNEEIITFARKTEADRSHAV